MLRHPHKHTRTRVCVGASKSISSASQQQLCNLMSFLIEFAAANTKRIAATPQRLKHAARATHRISTQLTPKWRSNKHWNTESSRRWSCERINKILLKSYAFYFAAAAAFMQRNTKTVAGCRCGSSVDYTRAHCKKILNIYGYYIYVCVCVCAKNFDNTGRFLNATMRLMRLLLEKARFKFAAAKLVSFKLLLWE